MTLPVDVYSPDQLSEAIMELRNYVAALRDSAVRAKVGGEAAIAQPQISEPLQHLLSAANATGGEINTLENLAGELEQLLAKAPVIHITLAALPSRTIKRQITLWFRTEIHPASLIVFSARGDIGGGAVVQAGSHLYDLSFKKQILTNKQRIMEIAGV